MILPKRCNYIIVNNDILYVLYNVHNYIIVIQYQIDMKLLIIEIYCAI